MIIRVGDLSFLSSIAFVMIGPTSYTVMRPIIDKSTEAIFFRVYLLFFLVLSRLSL